MRRVKKHAEMDKKSKSSQFPKTIIEAAASSTSGSNETNLPGNSSLSGLNDKVKKTGGSGVVSGISKADDVNVNKSKRSRPKKINENTISKSFLNTSKKIYDLMKENDGKLLKIFDKTLKFVKQINDTQKLQLKQQILDNTNNYVLFKSIFSLLKKENSAVEQELKILKSQQKDVIEEAGIDRKQEAKKNKNDTYRKVYQASTRDILPTRDARELVNKAGGSIMAATANAIKKATSRKQEEADDEDQNSNVNTEGSISVQLFNLKESIEKIPENIKSIQILDTLITTKNYISELLDEVVIIKKIIRKPQAANQTDSTTAITTKKEEDGGMLGSLLSGAVGAIALYITNILEKIKDSSINLLSGIVVHGIRGVITSSMKALFQSLGGAVGNIVKASFQSLGGMVGNMVKASWPFLVRAIIPAIISSLPALGIAAGVAYIAYGLNEAYGLVKDINKLTDETAALEKELREKREKAKQDAINDPNKSEVDKEKVAVGKDILDLSEKIDKLEREKKTIESLPEASDPIEGQRYNARLYELESGIKDLKKQREDKKQLMQDLKNKQIPESSDINRFSNSSNEYTTTTAISGISTNQSYSQSASQFPFSGLNSKTDLNNAILSLSNLVTAPPSQPSNTVVNAPTQQINQMQNTVVSPHMYRPSDSNLYELRLPRVFY